MTLFLLIETGTDICSVALARDNQIVELRENSDGKMHAQLLAVYIYEIMKKQNCTAADLNAIAVSEGPGSYTGLRVGVSTAKGMCYGAQKPLIAVGSLQSLVQIAIDNKHLPSPDCLIAPMIDARRMEVYTALFDTQARIQSDISAKIIDENSFAAELEKRQILFVGNGAGKCQTLLKHPSAHFADITASAAGMLKQTMEAWEQQRFVDVAYFEPFYLKDFVATTKKHQVIDISPET